MPLVKMARIPRATVNRLPLYLRVLERYPVEETTVSSQELADLIKENSAKVRKDLSFLGSYGVRGVGYNVEHLRFQIRRELGLTKIWPVIIVGAGNLGSALGKYGGFDANGFSIVGIYDSDPDKIGTTIGDLTVGAMEDIEGDAKELNAEIAIIATPVPAAQEVAERLAGAGFKSILNFAPMVLRVEGDIEIRRVDLSTELQILGYYVQQSLAES
ncbi:MAG: redox-sensing transcriptional repressor Rex [Acidimicrobiia bacterium]|nr:redox-sensing transcriptional repressor Rex [Acidimicrobiia bacterium]